MICLVMATKLEAEPFLAGLRLEKQATGPFTIYQNDELLLLLTGVGKVNAAGGLTSTLLTHHPRIVINVGAAGSTDDSTREGSVYQASQVFDLDRPHFRSGTPHLFKPDRLADIPDVTLGTRDKPVIAVDDRKEISKIAKLVDMEGSAVSQICRRFKVTHYLLKQVTDTPDHQTDQDIVKNIRAYRDALYSYYIDTVAPGLPSESDSDQ